MTAIRKPRSTRRATAGKVRKDRKARPSGNQSRMVKVRRPSRGDRQADLVLSAAMSGLAGPMVLSETKSPGRSLAGRSRIAARYDAAQTNDGNRRHWAEVDFLSADVANNHAIRNVLRQRARYEIANNTYARGIVSTLANDIVGTGPILQMSLGASLAMDDPAREGFAAANRVIEREFGQWMIATRQASKLRTMRMAQAGDGEAFAVIVTNPGVPGPVKLDTRLVEADQVADPRGDQYGLNGITLDDDGNPETYTVLRNHPGGSPNGTILGEFDEIPAWAMIHMFRQDRPGQHRGIPELTPALPLFAQLRRFTLAVLDAAESAADFSVILYTDTPPDGESDAVTPMDVIELERRMMTTMPAGWKAGQMKAEQPTTTYRDFKTEILKEIARCLNMPFNVASGDSSGYNYASGRLDFQTYYRSNRIDQDVIETVALDRLLMAWLCEAVAQPTVFPELAILRGSLPSDPRDLPHSWMWEGREHVDPNKEANGIATRLSTCTSTLSSEFSRQGKDWEPEVTQRIREIAFILKTATAAGIPESLAFAIATGSLSTAKPGAALGDPEAGLDPEE